MKNILIENIKKLPFNNKILKKDCFKKGEIITNYINNRSHLYIIEKGSADLMRHDYNGNKIIVERFFESDLFGEVFYQITTNNELFVIANEETIIYEFDYKAINTIKHLHIQKIFSDMLLEKIIEQNDKLELLTKTTTRDKLLFYFSSLSRKSFNTKIKLPFSYTDLAAYLSINRSSMMREIKYLIEEGFIIKNGKYIRLLY